MSIGTFFLLAALIAWAAFCAAVAVSVTLRSWVDYHEQKHAVSKALGR